MSIPTTMSDRVHSELTLLYQTSVSDLAFFKQQQWSCANYTLLILAAIPSASILANRRLSILELVATSVLAALIACVSVHLLRKLERAILIRRDRLAEIRDQFTQEFNRAWGVQPKPDESVSVCFVLLAAVIVAAAIVIWLLVARYGA